MNPVTAEIVNNALNNVAEESASILKFSSFSVNIREREDFSIGVFDSKLRMVAQSKSIPVHLGAMPLSLKILMKYFDATELHDGDVLITNDPYKAGGTHLPDISLIKPVFFSGNLIGYISTRAHHADVGGKTPGSMPAFSKTLDEEGVVIPPTKIVKNGVLDRNVFEKILKPMRNIKERRGDFNAQIAACNVGAKRLVALFKKYGQRKMEKIIDYLINHSKRKIIKLVKQVPQSKKLSFVDHVEHVTEDGSIELVPIQVKIKRTKDDNLQIDFTGTGKQVEGNINAPLAVTYSATYYVFRSLLESENVFTNSGLYEPLKITVPEGSLLNPLPPAAVAAGNVETSQRIVDTLLGSLAEIFPEKIPAASTGSMNNLTFGGMLPTGEEFTYYETIGGGMGAMKNNNGESGIHVHMTNTLNTPVEVIETYYPVRILQYKVLKDSGGKGIWNGGNGMKRVFEFLQDNVTVSVISERRATSPWGLFGGEKANRGKNIVITRTGKGLNFPSKFTIKLNKGDKLIIETAGGGGYGDPSKKKN